jgi:hypothetical protein
MKTTAENTIQQTILYMASDIEQYSRHFSKPNHSDLERVMENVYDTVENSVLCGEFCRGTSDFIYGND